MTTCYLQLTLPLQITFQIKVPIQMLPQFSDKFPEDLVLTSNCCILFELKWLILIFYP